MNRKESAERESTWADMLLVVSAMFLGMVIGGSSVGEWVKEAHKQTQKYVSEWQDAIKKELEERKRLQVAEEARLKEEAKKKEAEDAKDWKELTDAVTFNADRKLLKLPPLPEGVQWGVALKGVDPPVLIHPFYQKPRFDVSIKPDGSSELSSETAMEDVKVFRIQNGKALGFAFSPTPK
jgi:Sec-independent protein translocase protein TatA